MKGNIKKIIKLTVLGLIIGLLFIPQDISITKALKTDNQEINSIQSIPMNTATKMPVQNLTFPGVRVKEIVLPENYPEEGEEFEISITIENNDSIQYNSFLLVVQLIETINQEGPGNNRDEIVVASENVSLGELDANSAITVTIRLVGDFGQYTLSAYVIASDAVIPNSTRTISVQILGPVVGDIPTLIGAILILFLFIGFIALFPSVYDRLRYESTIKNNNNSKRGE